MDQADDVRQMETSCWCHTCRRPMCDIHCRRWHLELGLGPAVPRAESDGGIRWKPDRLEELLRRPAAEPTTPPGL